MPTDEKRRRRLETWAIVIGGMGIMVAVLVADRLLM